MTLSGDWRRTHDCGALRAPDVGKTVVLNGWVRARRDHGGIYFLDLGDRYGITQVVLPEKLLGGAAAGAGGLKLGPEYVLAVRGKVVAREAQNVNPDRPTGAVEVVAEEAEVLSTSPVPPFEVDDQAEVALETRLKHRYVDLRRPRMQKNLVHRSRFVNALRRAFEAQGFVEVETPILTKATPEGARDYLVPSRVHPGEFYALPQSPQIFKQLLMVAGLERYFQVARCFRDEDLRADRQPEFTQLDMEMSFVVEEDVFRVWETALAAVFREVMGIELRLPFPRLSYSEAMERYGVDKPDLRYGLELADLAAWARSSEARFLADALAGGGRVKSIAVPAAHELSRKDVEALEGAAKELGARGLAWWKAGAGGGSGPLAKFAAGDRARALMSASGAAEGDTVLVCAGPEALVQRVLGELRVQLGRKLGLAPPATESGRWCFLWVVDFPMFLWNEEERRFESAHHPFTAPADWKLPGPGESLANVKSRAYDLVLNGWELGSGSIRIHRQDVQRRVFEILGIGAEEAARKFGFLLEALASGAPPHGGFALGLDRTVAMSLGLDNIRDVVAFPKTASAADLMCQAPSEVDARQLAEVHVAKAGKALESKRA
jgi:aspartyl-tRNA synthetase